MFCISNFRLFFSCRDCVKTESNQTETVELNISLTNRNQLFLLS